MEKLQKQNFFNPVVLLILFVGIFASIFIYSQIDAKKNEAHDLEYYNLIKRQTAAVQRELNANVQVLHSVKSFYDSSSFVDRFEFREFVKTSLKEHRSIQALEWIPYIHKDERVKYEDQANKDLNMPFNIRSKHNGKMIISHVKEEYFPVYYLEPLKGNEKALGFDLASSDIRLKSLKEAISKRDDVATAKITLVQEVDEQSGFLVFTPIWEKTNENLIKGFALGVFRIGDMVSEALKIDKLDNSLLDVWIVDTTDKNKHELLYTNTEIKNTLHTPDSSSINIKGRTWTLYAQPSAIFEKKYHSSNLAFIGLLSSLFITGLITYIVAMKVAKEKNLEQLVKEKTKILRDSNKRYESLLDMFDKKVIASRTDLKGIITYTTKAFEDISGYSKEELLGVGHNILRHEDMPRELYVNLWRTIKAGKVFSAEIKNKRKDGTFYWVRAVIMPEFDDEGNICSYFAVRDDITAKKEVEELNKTLSDRVDIAVVENQKKDQLLLQQSKLAAMGEMIGAIAHQWRQPLNTLAIKIQFIEDDYEDELIDQEYLEQFSKESMELVNFMSKTIDDFRNFFTIDKVKGLFNVKTKINETSNMLRAQLENYDIKLEIKGEGFQVLGYASEFQQVVLNIINNAKDELVEKERNDGIIIVEIEANEEEGYIRIQDNAGGIPQDIIDRVFEPYFTTKEQGKGTGLGLYMSKMIIEENMHGKLSIQNIDEGAQFTINVKVENE